MKRTSWSRTSSGTHTVVVIGTDTIAIITVSWTNSRAFTIFVTLVSARNTVVQFLAVSYATCTGDTYTAGIS